MEREPSNEEIRLLQFGFVIKTLVDAMRRDAQRSEEYKRIIEEFVTGNKK
jgi:hypothetical protein